MDNSTYISELKEKVKIFCEDRAWDQFHNAKELSIGIVTEGSELLQHFRFKTNEQVNQLFENPVKKEEITEEIADVLYFLLRLAQLYKIDLTTELVKKIDKNNKKYPIEKVKGLNKKYSEYD